jgi:hypothetical protein
MRPCILSQVSCTVVAVQRRTHVALECNAVVIMRMHEVLVSAHHRVAEWDFGGYGSKLPALLTAWGIC